MDFLSHLVIGYMVLYLFGLRADYLYVAAIVGAALPDFDIFFFPLAKRVRLLQHHGIFHTYIFITIAAIPLSLLLIHYHMNTFIINYIAILTGGSSHLLMDSLTDFSVTPFRPFNNIQVGLGVERAVNPYILALSGIFTIMLFTFRYYSIPVIYYTEGINILIGLMLLNYLLRASLFTYLYVFFKQDGELSIQPTSIPYRWYVIRWSDKGNRYSSMMLKVDLLNGNKKVIKNISIGADGNEEERAYFKAMSWISGHKLSDPSLFPYRIKKFEDRISVLWYYPQYSFKKYFMGVEVLFYNNGDVKAKEIFGRTDRD